MYPDITLRTDRGERKDKWTVSLLSVQGSFHTKAFMHELYLKTRLHEQFSLKNCIYLGEKASVFQASITMLKQALLNSPPNQVC